MLFPFRSSVFEDDGDGLPKGHLLERDDLLADNDAYRDPTNGRIWTQDAVTKQWGLLPSMPTIDPSGWAQDNPSIWDVGDNEASDNARAALADALRKQDAAARANAQAQLENAAYIQASQGILGEGDPSAWTRDPRQDMEEFLNRWNLQGVHEYQQPTQLESLDDGSFIDYTNSRYLPPGKAPPMTSQESDEILKRPREIR